MPRSFKRQCRNARITSDAMGESTMHEPNPSEVCDLFELGLISREEARSLFPFLQPESINELSSPVPQPACEAPQ